MSQPVRRAVDQILSVAAMRAAEQVLVDAGTSVDALMQTAGRGAAEWVWRVAAGRSVTVLCGPGNNGGDGYVIAETLRQRGTPVRVIAALPPRTAAASAARAAYQGAVDNSGAGLTGEVLVDCLFGSGLVRPLADEHAALLTALAASHPQRIAIDVPSGIDSDTGRPLNPGLPDWQVTLALGAWKPAHFLMPACASMGQVRLVDIGCHAVPGAPVVVRQPRLHAPAADAHKYRRGLVAIVGGVMPGAAQLAACAAQGGAAGYVRLVAAKPVAGGLPDVVPDVVVDPREPAAALDDARIGAVLIGPGLGRDHGARDRLVGALNCQAPLVLDADALMLLTPADLAGRTGAILATPHEGELTALERAFGLAGAGTRLDRAQALAQAAGMIVLAKGPDTVIAAPDGRAAFAPRASAWLSVAGTGDVLAGIAASRLAAGGDALVAAAEAVWLHGEAARLAGPAFSAAGLAAMVRNAYAACL